MPIRNGVLARWLSAGGLTTFVGALVPATDTYIVKDARVYNNGALASTVQVLVQTPGSTEVAVLVNQVLMVGQMASFSGFVCGSPGDQIVFTTTQNGVYFWVSGADLPGHL